MPDHFIHLRVHSAYSLLEGALQLSDIIAYAKAECMPAIAVTDTSNLFAALEFAQKAAGAGIQALTGCVLNLSTQDETAGQPPQTQKSTASAQPIVLLATSKTGYLNLVQLVSELYAQDKATLDLPVSWLKKYAEGLICLSGGPAGPVGARLAMGDQAGAQALFLSLKSIFGDRFYAELQRHEKYDTAIEAQTIALAYEHDVPLVATNDAYFKSTQDYEAHDALLAIAESSVIAVEDRRRLTADHALRPQAEMIKLFADLPEAIDNTVEIARRCHFIPETHPPILPRFLPDQSGVDPLKVESDELRRQAKEGLEARLSVYSVPGVSRQDYEERLNYELDIIERMQFPGYFLIVADFIKWAKSKDIAVGPGRGSGAGSLVAYALTITDLDPLRFSLLFERFLNPERVSMPDFDIDFCQDRRDEVIRYVQNKYGSDRVAQIITFGTLQARAVLRDVGRVLQMPYGQVDRLCKLVPANPANPVSLPQAIEMEPKFQEEVEKEPIVERLLDMAQKLEGLYRHASTHAAGIVIGDRPLNQLVPLYADQRSSMPVTQFNMKWVEQAGLVKFDFLGLKTLTILQQSVQLLARRDIEVDLGNIDLNDEKTYQMLSKGDTVGVFQIESGGMRKALIGMQPDRIEDIIALVALYRPGPMENIPTYNARKHGEEEIQSIHPMIDDLMTETQGVIVYQEQVMQIAQVLAGYSLGEADLLRRAMGKKIRAEMDKQRSRFVSGAVENGVDKAQADFIFDLLAKFADYGFNKSHAAAYAIVSYQTAYLKAHYPAEFFAASMTYDMGNTDRLKDLKADAERLGISIVPPSVQTSHRRFEVEEEKIFYSLAAIKGVGEAAVDHIVEVRADTPFADLEDFCTRIDPRMVNKRVFEGLIAAGALDCFDHPRANLYAGIERMSGMSARVLENNLSGQNDMFGTSVRETLVLPEVDPMPLTEQLHRELQAVGFYLSAHPLDSYRTTLQKLRIQDYTALAESVRHGATAGRLAGTVTARQERRTRTGNKMGVIQFSDASGQYEAVIFSEGLSMYRELLEPGTSVVVAVNAENRPEGISLRIQSVTPLDQMAGKLHNALRIFIRSDKPLPHLAKQLKADKKGGLATIVLIANDRDVEIELSETVKVDPHIAAALRAVPGVDEVEMV